MLRFWVKRTVWASSMESAIVCFVGASGRLGGTMVLAKWGGVVQLDAVVLEDAWAKE